MGGDLAGGGINDGATTPKGTWSSEKIEQEIAAVGGAYAYRKQVLDFVDNTLAPPTEVSGDRYILDDTGVSNAAWDGAAALSIVEFNGTTWDEIVPSSGWRCFVAGEGQDRAYIDDGTPAWEPRPNLNPHALGGAQHTADTLANLNTKISDGTVDKTTDPRDSDTTRIDIAKIGTPARDKLDEHLGFGLSAGTRAGVYITDAGSQQFDVTLGAGFIRTSNDHSAPLKAFEWVASLANAIPDGTVRYVGVEYNAGSPRVSVRTTDNWNRHDDFRLGSVVREGTVLHILNNPQDASNGVIHAYRRFYNTEPLKRADRLGGLILGETGTRNLSVTAGRLYDGLTEFVIAAIDTSVASTFDVYYGSFTKVAAQTQWDNAQYDNAGVLTAFSANKWGVHWLYIEADGELVLLYGQAQFNTEAAADLSMSPASVPLRLQTHGKLIGRVLFQEGAASAAQVESVFDVTFQTTGTSDHNNLSNLQGGIPGEYNHLSNAEIAALGGARFFIPAADPNGTLGDHPVRNITGTGNARFMFAVPADFASLISLVVVAHSAVTGSVDIDITSDYGKNGEAYNNHSEARDGGVSPTSVTANVIARLDISDVFSSLEGGDVCGFNWDHNSIGGTIAFWGVELRYNT